MRLGRGKSLIREVAPGQYVIGNNIFSPALSLNSATGTGKIGQENIVLDSDLFYISGTHVDYDEASLAGSSFNNDSITLQHLPKVSGIDLMLQGDADFSNIVGESLDYDAAIFSTRPLVRIAHGNSTQDIPVLISGDFFDESDFPVLLESMRNLSGHFDDVLLHQGEAYASGIAASREAASNAIAAADSMAEDAVTMEQLANDLDWEFSESMTTFWVEALQYISGNYISGTDACFQNRPTVGYDEKIEVALTTEVSSEELSRVDSDLSLTTRVSAEEDVRDFADISLSTRVSTEESARAVAATTLTTRISTEESVRSSAGVSLTARVSTEESARAVAATTLTTRISTEESVRSSADISLTTSITSEEDARILADTGLSSAINAISFLNITGEKLTYDDGIFSNRPTVGGLPVLISGDAAAAGEAAVDLKLIKKYAIIFG